MHKHRLFSCKEVIPIPRVRRCRYRGCTKFAMVPNHYCSKHIKHEAEYQAERDKYRYHQSTKATSWRYNHVTRYRNKAKTAQNKFYHTKQWQSLRQVVFNRDYHLCQYCRVNAGNVVDHVVPIEVDSSLIDSVDNLVTCCRNCHQIKTRWEELWYGTGLHNTKTGNPEIHSIEAIREMMNAV